jgi:LVIVD repeat
MKHLFRVPVLLALVVGIIAFPLAAGAGHATDPHTPNLVPRGHILEPASLTNPAIGNPDVHTDIAFWGKFAIQGNWDGFNIRDIRNPDNPKQVGRAFCEGDQGDVVVFKNIVVRSWNSPAPGTTACGGEPVPAGWEGLHIFDISDKTSPELVGSVQLACGSHTATGIPDRKNGRLIIYSSPSAHDSTPPIDPNPPATCDWFDVVEVPLRNPEDASLIRTEPSDHTCHDIGVILGSAMKAGCAGGTGVRVFSLGGPNGGSLEDPLLLYHVEEPGVTIGHSAAWSWDGETLIFGHEPSGGVVPECEVTDPDLNRKYFFYDGDTGAKVGEYLMPRPQSATENCTLHNLNTIPLKSGRDVLVHGSYQSGTAVVDFTDPANAVELAWSDPPPIVPTDIGGAWSTYWYNDYLYETNITEGLNIFEFTGPKVRGNFNLAYLNPQTQEFTIKAKRGKRK